MSERFDCMNVNAVNYSAPPPCEICGSIEHLTLNCQIGSPFAQDTSEVNYVNNFNLRPTNEWPIFQYLFQVGGITQISLIGLTLMLLVCLKWMLDCHSDSKDNPFPNKLLTNPIKRPWWRACFLHNKSKMSI